MKDYCRRYLSIAFTLFASFCVSSLESQASGNYDSLGRVAPLYAVDAPSQPVAVETFLTPYQDAESHFLQFLDAATTKCYLASYSITNPHIINKLVELHGRGVDVEVITDKTQASGPTEQAALAVLKENSIPVFIGRSSDNALMHCKFVVLDDNYVEDGSWNFTTSANRQDNILNFSNSKVRAKQFLAYWLKIRADLRY